MARPRGSVSLARRAVLYANTVRPSYLPLVSRTEIVEYTYTSDRTFRSRGIGAWTPSEGDTAGYGGSGSKFRGKIPGSQVAYRVIHPAQLTNFINKIQNSYSQ
jgi:hypothetical protein